MKGEGDDSYLTTDQVAKIHTVSRGSVIKWIANGDLEAVKLGRDYLVRTSAAENYKRKPITGRPRKSD
jgi:excisionase family DNA binding protein